MGPSHGQRLSFVISGSVSYIFKAWHHVLLHWIASLFDWTGLCLDVEEVLSISAFEPSIASCYQETGKRKGSVGDYGILYC